MKHRYVFIFIIILFCQCDLLDRGTTYKLYYLGGQSNMDGYGFIEDLPEELNRTFEGIKIFHGNSAADGGEIDGRGIWADLRPGHGVGFKSDGITNSYSNRFGVELSFAHRLRQLEPNAHIAIIKYSKGGTSIDAEAAGRFGCWEPDYTLDNGVNQYDHFLATANSALAVKDIDGDGKKDKLIPAGILWMQGESDGNFNEDIAQRYEANLDRLINLIRKAFKNTKLPVVIGRISDSGLDEDGKVWDYGDIIREAQQSFVNNDANAELVTSTDNYNYSDSWHYDSQGYIDLGKQFADALCQMDNKSSNDYPSIEAKPVIEIPIKLDRNRVIIPVSIRGSRKLDCILDTGMTFEGVYLFHKELIEEIEMPDAIEVRVGGAGSGEASQAILVDSVTISAGNGTFSNQRILISQSSTTQTFTTDGVIGYTIFGSYTVEIDYDKKNINLYDPEKNINFDASWSSLPLTFKKQIPFLNASVSIAGEDEIPLIVYIDLAAGEAIELLIKPDQKFKLPENLTQQYLGTGLSGDISGGVGRIHTLNIGGFRLDDVPAAFPPGEVRSKQEGADGILGNNSLRRFNLVFDYTRELLHMRPNRKFDIPFN